MDMDWHIAPSRGIGRLTFGLSPEEVASMTALYGRPSPLKSHAHVADDVEAVIAQLGADMSAEDIEALRQSVQGMDSLMTQNLMARAPILLEYRDGALEAVSVEARHEEVHFQGQRVFGLGASEVLTLFERANGAPGRYRSTEAAFDNLAVSLHCFSMTSPQREVRAMPEKKREFRERAVTLRREPYRPPSELDQFTTFSFA